MPERSLAAVMVAERRIELQEFPLPEVGPDDGILRVEAVGICGTDWGFYLGEGIRMGARFPFVLGHEIVGHIEKVGGEAARRWQVSEGDRVIVEEPIPCGRCRHCLSGRYPRCDENRRYGSHVPTTVPPSLWGGCSRYMYLHPNSIVHKISESVPADVAPLFIPISNGIRWMQQIARAGVGDTVVIQGPGQHGLGCVIGAKEAGVSCVIASGLSKDANRLEVARQLGADLTVNVEKENLVEKVREVTEGRMADVVVDISDGATEPVTAALDLVRRSGGVIILAGFKRKPIPNFISDKIIFNEITVIGVRGHDFKSVESAVRLIESGKYPLRLMCTHRFALEKTEEAVRTVGGEGAENAIHVSVMPNG